MDGREPMAAVLTEQEIYERAGGGSAAISGSGAIGFFSLDPGKIGGINDSRVVVREKILLAFWHALILSVNRGAGAFFFGGELPCKNHCRGFPLPYHRTSCRQRSAWRVFQA